MYKKKQKFSLKITITNTSGGWGEEQLLQMLSELNDNKDIKCTHQIIQKNVFLIRK